MCLCVCVGGGREGQGGLKVETFFFMYGLKVTNSNHFYSMSKQHICTSLMDIQAFLQEICYRQAISQRF